ncbi:MAG: DNA ligase (ATP) [Fusobacteria bacterium]|nr:MAG: DNA ligase (ATP) [Fusobacteriota bacterium]KAF0229114.1 MAG: DNA ligase [Fusobacteriota bacterium]
MARELDEYQKKRDPNRTTEPKGKVANSGKQLVYVMQHHAASHDHYDFRLEWDGVLLSWAIPKGPSFNTKDKRLAIEVENHPLEYRDFEGTIPKGEYGGGTVMIWDEGEWEPQEGFEKGLEEGSLKIILKGNRLKGKWALVRLKQDKDNKKNWLLIKEKDKYAMDNDGISEYKTSVRTNRTMNEITENKEAIKISLPFEKTKVQLAKLVDKVPEGEDWIYELKYDGYRIIAYLNKNKVQLMSRNGQDYSLKFKSITEALIKWGDGRSMVLDGEVVILDKNGRTDFQALQEYLKAPKGQTPIFIMFDLLALSGKDLRGETLLERKGKLSSLMKNNPQILQYSNHIDIAGKDTFVAACQVGMEGIICKKANSIYSGTRNGDWLKVKCGNRQEFVIGGYSLTNKKKSGVSALLLGVYEGEDLIYVGRAGTGFTQKNMTHLEKQFENIKRKTSTFIEAPKKRSDEEIIWLSPKLVAEISFAEWTNDNLLRQASFKGLRMDKAPMEVIRENYYQNEDEDVEVEETNANRKTATVNGIKISSPDKEMFEGSGITKEDIAKYYNTVAKRMMIYVGNRILSLVRCPHGIPGECFYQKHLLKEIKGLKMMPIEEKSGDNEEYFYLENAEALIRLVQMGTIEFHTWGSKVQKLETPDMMVFDLDPEEGMDLEQVREGVRDMKRILDEISLKSFLKTSGGKGYHIVVPLEPSADWNAVKSFAKMTAIAMEERWPDRYTSNMRKENRKGKIFIDWVRNGRSATSVAPYSVRARKGAPVSMPISWEELDTVAPNGISIEDAIKRLQGEDPWKGFFKIKQKIYQ